MNRVRFLLSTLALIVLGACSTQLDTDNPYDPDTPPDKQAKASMSGVITLEGFGDVTQVEVNVAGLTVHPDATGAYQVTGIAPGVQEILFRLTGYQDHTKPRLFDPGEELELDVRLKVHRGGVVGSVQLEEAGDHSGVTITLTPEGGAVTDVGEDFALTSLSAPTGYFVFDDVPVGNYDLTATKPHYVGQVVADVDVQANQVVLMETIVLPPVAGVVEILPHADCVNPGFPDWGSEATYTCRPEITVRTIGVNALDMKISEDPTFQDPALGDTVWVQYEMERAFTLSAGDGPKKVFVLLRGNNDMVSEILEGHAVLDTTAPAGTVEVMLRAEQCDASTCYTNSESLLVQVTAIEPDLMMILSLDNQFTEPAQLYSPYANMLLQNTSSLQEIHLRLVDRAGNAFDTVAANMVVLDLHPPTLPVVATTPQGYSRDPQGIVLTMLGASQDNIDTTLRYEYQIDPPPSGWGNEPWLLAEFDQNDDLLNIVALDPCLAGCDYQLYVYKLRAVDRAGNIGDPATAQLVLDQTAPDHPRAGVKQITSDYDPADLTWRRKIVNADVATVWVSLDSSADPNFIQFKISTDGGSTWHETGVGIGGIQIPVMLTPNQDNIVWICGRDMAGNESCSDQSGNPVALPDRSIVTFVEDSMPPSAPALHPQVGEVNADRVTMKISTPSQDDHGIDKYEYSVNGGLFLPLLANTDLFEVDLMQDFENTIQVRAVDVAQNRSGTTTAVISEDSTLFSQATVTAVDQAAAAFDMNVSGVAASAQENTWVVASMDGTDAAGEVVEGAAFIDLRTRENLWLDGAHSMRIYLKGGWVVMDVPLDLVCERLIDPTVDPAAEPICRCFQGDCAGFMEYEELINWGQASTLVIADLSSGQFAFQWIRVDPGAYPPGHPLVGFWDDASPHFSFDGNRLAWVVKKTQNGPCQLFVANPGGAAPDSAPTWMVDYTWGTRPLVGNEEVEYCAQVAIGGDLVVWGQRIDDEVVGTVFGESFIANTANGTQGWLAADGLRYAREGRSDITFDCETDPWSRTPVCRNLFWIDASTVTPNLTTLDLGLVPADLDGVDLFANGLTDTIRYGMIELMHLSAENGRVVWQDSLAGTPSIFYQDLSECDGPPGNRDCLMKFHILTQSYYRDSHCSLWGDLVTYWRNMEDGRHMNLLDMGSYPWLIPEPGLAGLPVVADQKVLHLWGDPLGGAQPYHLRLYDPADRSVTNLWGFDSMVWPIAFHSDASLTSVGLLQVAPDGTAGVMYCDTTLNCDAADAVNLFQTGLSPPHELLPGGYRGTPQRLVWTELNTIGESYVLDCDMDPNSPGAPCRSGAYRVLFQTAVPIRICNYNMDGNATAQEMVLILVDESGSGETRIYRVDLLALETAGPPPAVDSFAVLDGRAEFTRIPGQFGQHAMGCGFFDRQSAIDIESGNMAALLTNSACARCFTDNGGTAFVAENCASPPCCGDAPCVCAAGDSCQDEQEYMQVLKFDGANQTEQVYGKFIHSGPTNADISGRWLVWQERLGGQDDLILLDLQTGRQQRLTYHITDQIFPTFGMLPDGLHLVWADNRLGGSQIFHTLLE